MKPKTLQDKIRNKQEQINEALEFKSRYPVGSDVYDQALKLLDEYETELEILLEALKVEQAGGEII